jgi:hypothetical protein
VKIGNITFDCADPDRLCAFWAAALGYKQAELPPDMRAELEAAGVVLEERAVAEDPEMGVVSIVGAGMRRF